MTLHPGRSPYCVLLVVFSCLSAGASAPGPDPAVLSYRLPADIKWTDSAEYSGLRSAVLYGDPAKPGPYAVRNRFAPNTFSRPHFHSNDRFIVVVAGTWWVGTGDRYDPASTTPMPVGSAVVHYGGRTHYDGAKDEACEVIIYGIGPVTSTRVDRK